MPELFLLLLASGIMIASAIPSPRSVTLHWLRLAGILSLCFVGLAIYFRWSGADDGGSGIGGVDVRGTGPVALGGGATLVATLVAISAGAILAHLALVQTARRNPARFAALVAGAAGVIAASLLLDQTSASIAAIRGAGPVHLGAAGLVQSGETGLVRTGSLAITLLISLLSAVLVGGVLMDMLLGHAYLNSADMTMAPFRRLNGAMGIALGLRTLLAVGITMLMHLKHPVPHLWGVWGLYIGTRWLVGLAMTLLFLHMAHDCIGRRATQSATGILYVAAVLMWIGELIGIYLAVNTGLPF